MSKAWCRLKIFSLSARAVFLPSVQSFSLCVEIPMLIEFIVAVQELSHLCNSLRRDAKV